MSKLITGGTGFLGAEIARLLVSHGEDVILFDIHPNHNRIKGTEGNVKVVKGNLAYWPEVLNVVKENNVEGIYHLGGMLSVPSNQNPWASFQTNVCGTMHVLEAARLFDVRTVVFSSTTATYGLGITHVVTDETIQRPINMYGCGKLYCELLGTFYRNRFGMDFRGLRYPAIIGPGVNTPGVLQYNSWMIEYAIQGKPFECNVQENTKTPVMYYKDAAMAIYKLYHAPKENIETVNYNCAGVTPIQTAKELELVIRKYIPDFKIEYKPNLEVLELRRGRVDVDIYDDSRAREEWGWKPSYTSLEAVIEAFIEELK
jgi:nucleoside-diphosphate-sugar epimerase